VHLARPNRPVPGATREPMSREGRHRCRREPPYRRSVDWPRPAGGSGTVGVTGRRRASAASVGRWAPRCGLRRRRLVGRWAPRCGLRRRSRPTGRRRRDPAECRTAGRSSTPACRPGWCASGRRIARAVPVPARGYRAGCRRRVPCRSRRRVGRRSGCSAEPRSGRPPWWRTGSTADWTAASRGWTAGTRGWTAASRGWTRGPGWTAASRAGRRRAGGDEGADGQWCRPAARSRWGGTNRAGAGARAGRLLLAVLRLGALGSGASSWSSTGSSSWRAWWWTWSPRRRTSPLVHGGVGDPPAASAELSRRARRRRQSARRGQSPDADARHRNLPVPSRGRHSDRLGRSAGGEGTPQGGCVLLHRKGTSCPVRHETVSRGGGDVKDPKCSRPSGSGVVEADLQPAGGALAGVGAVLVPEGFGVRPAASSRNCPVS